MTKPAAAEAGGVNLTTPYLGLTLRNPLVASPGPLTQSVEGIRQLAEAGAGAIVLPSLFEEQIRREAERDRNLSEAGTESFGEALSYLPATEIDVQPRQYLSLVERAAAAVSIPVIASLNGSSSEGWTGYAAAIEAAGAAALELNVYYLSADPLVSARDAEARYVEILSSVKGAVTIPVAVKLSPYFSSLGEMALRLSETGADGLVLFNRFMQTDIDPETLAVSAGIRLSQPAEAVLPRSWIARLRGRVPLSLAASTGVESASDVVAYLLAGADAVMTTSALLRHGPDHIATLLEGLRSWMARKGFIDLGEVRGRLSATAAGDPAAFGRANYLATIDGASRAFGPR